MIPRVEPEGMLSENRFPPPIESGAGFFGIMLWNSRDPPICWEGQVPAHRVAITSRLNHPWSQSDQ